MKVSKRSSRDLDEIAPNRFVMSNPHIASVLKSEGVITGRLFELTSWRREGLLARLRERGFIVRTLVDRVEALPAPPPPQPIGGIGWRPLATTNEQFGHFDLRQLRWHPLAPTLRDGMPGVVLCDGWVVRRRKGRGLASFYLVHKERSGGIGLRPLDETEALLQGYAQALAFDPRPLLVTPHPAPDGDAEGTLLLPMLELPRPYREALELGATRTTDGWLVGRRNWPLVQALFRRLGIVLTVDA